jgi:hypothetical protein
LSRSKRFDTFDNGNDREPPLKTANVPGISVKRVLGMVKVVLRSTVAAVALMVGFSHIVAAAPITSNWTPGNAGNWFGGPGGDAVN